MSTKVNFELSPELIGQKMHIEGPYISAHMRSDDWVSPWDQDGLSLPRRQRPQYRYSHGHATRPIIRSELLRLDTLEPITAFRFRPIPYDYTESRTPELALSNAENVVRWRHMGLLQQGQEVGSLVVAHFTVIDQICDSTGYFAFKDQVKIVDVLAES